MPAFSRLDGVTFLNDCLTENSSLLSLLHLKHVSIHFRKTRLQGIYDVDALAQSEYVANRASIWPQNRLL